MAELLTWEPDLTLAAFRERLGLEFSLATVHNARGHGTGPAGKYREDVARARTE